MSSVPKLSNQCLTSSFLFSSETQQAAIRETDRQTDKDKESDREKGKERERERQTEKKEGYNVYYLQPWILNLKYFTKNPSLPSDC